MERSDPEDEDEYGYTESKAIVLYQPNHACSIQKDSKNTMRKSLFWIIFEEMFIRT